MSCIPFFKLLHISEYHYKTKGFSESFNTLIIDVLLYSKCHIKAKACLCHCPKQSFCFSIITIVTHLSIDKQCYINGDATLKDVHDFFFTVLCIGGNLEASFDL